MLENSGLRYLALIMALGFGIPTVATGCAWNQPTVVKADPGSESVEIISQNRVKGGWGKSCERVGDVSDRVGPKPQTPESGMSPAAVQVRNNAHERGATHVAVGNEKSYSCGINTVKCDGCGRICYEMPATAYRCSQE